MNQPNTDLFGGQRISIVGNPKLEGIANHILDLYRIKPEMLNGETVGEINRKVTLEVMLDSGLVPIIKSGNTENFKSWFLDKKQCPTEEEIARALRYLVERDYLRLPSKVIVAAEQNRQRISRSVR